MIYDKIKNNHIYYNNETWKKLFEFISSLELSSEEKKYFIDENKVYANVERYETKSLEDAVTESHRKYIDIQLVLQGEEIIRVNNIADLIVKQEYDAERDVIFYETPSQNNEEVVLQAGMFCLLFPQDAHSPQIAVKTPQSVKKVVVKIDKDLL